MFLHNLKYEFLNNIRQKDVIFWVMCFPIILGTFFYIGFGKLYEKEEIFSEIHIAVTFVKEDDIFSSVIGKMEAADESPFAIISDIPVRGTVKEMPLPTK